MVVHVKSHAIPLYWKRQKSASTNHRFFHVFSGVPSWIHSHYRKCEQQWQNLQNITIYIYIYRALRIYIHQYTVILYGHIKNTERRSIIHQYGDWYTGRWWVGCYIWYNKEGDGWAAAPPSPLLAVLDITAHPSMASVSTSYYSMWHYNCLWILKG